MSARANGLREKLKLRFGVGELDLSEEEGLPVVGGEEKVHTELPLW